MRTLDGDGVGAGGGSGGREQRDVCPQPAVAAPRQVCTVHLPAGRLLLHAALPALEAVAALCESVEAACVVVPHLLDTTHSTASKYFDVHLSPAVQRSSARELSMPVCASAPCQ